MFTQRRKKLAIAAAILVVGVGTALLFRREEPQAEVSRSIPTPRAVAPKPNVPSVAPASEQAAKLAGRIEPYSGPLPAEANHAAPSAGAHPIAPSKIDSATSAAPASDAAYRNDPPDAAGKIGGDAVVESSSSSLKWQTVRRPDGDAGSTLPRSSQANLPGSVVGQGTLDVGAKTVRHIIADGDTLASIAHRHLGDPARQLEIYEYNRDVLASPELLPIGKELRIPPPGSNPPALSASLGETRQSAAPLDTEPRPLVAVAPPPRAMASDNLPAHPTTSLGASSTYVVQPHDTLALIARKVYGDISRQGDLMAANRQLLRAPKDLRPGMRLVVPPPSSGRR